MYRVIQIKLNQFVEENVYMITDLPTKCVGGDFFASFVDQLNLLMSSNQFKNICLCC